MIEREKKHKRIGLITSVGTQVILLLLFYFLIAWREPDPPIPSYGIELSFGIENQGAGQQPVTNPQPEEEVKEIQATQEEVQEEVPEGSIENPAEPAEEVVEPLTETSSPDVIEPKPNESPITETPREETKTGPTETQKDETQVNPEAMMPSATQSDETSDSKGTTNQKGNEGKEDGTIDGRALMGQQGATDGANLDMAGWTWDSKPNPEDESTESGKIVYRITIDDTGYIKNVELLSSTVSPVVERYYRQSVEKITFSQTSNTPAPPTSTGKITFIIRSR